MRGDVPHSPSCCIQAFSSYYKGDFEQKMSRREASLILGISPAATKAKVRESHRRIMVLNHPDKEKTWPSGFQSWNA
ncbi:DnaJ subfamily C member 15 [Ataeniobius toweri]|uniref:DnaJ subfamily C member 15 n=1 Tax=Ataeniobius toweri TaxID=208326 RepID=A0ABU7ARA6_9TELE|nr:DnaJ subfamily C member 15 [Ataeniobius toweri]